MEWIQYFAGALLVLACVAAVFSEKIDEHFKTKGKIRRWILGFSTGVSVISIAALVVSAFCQ